MLQLALPLSPSSLPMPPNQNLPLRVLRKLLKRKVPQLGLSHLPLRELLKLKEPQLEPSHLAQRELLTQP